MKKICLSLLACGVVFAQPQALFNGRDLSGWEMVGPGRFVVENGLLKTEGGMGLLWYKGRKLGNETVRIVFKTTGDRDNSGVFIRMPEPPTDPWYGVHNGYEVQIDAAGDEWHRTGAIYSLSRSTKVAQKPAGEWNTLEIQLDGLTTRVVLNGELVNELTEGQPVPERKEWYEPVRGPRPVFGFIGLQNHDPRTTVYFREVTAIPTDRSPRPMTQGERDRLLSYYHATRKQILDAVSGLSNAQWTFRPAPDKWSIADIVEHLALTEDLLFDYATAADFSLKPPEQKLTTEALIQNMLNRSRPADAPAELRPGGKWKPGFPLIGAFRAARDAKIRWIGGTREPLRSYWVRWQPQPVESYQALFLIPAHTERHLAQIQEVKASPGYPKQ